LGGPALVLLIEVRGWMAFSAFGLDLLAKDFLPF